MEGRGRSPAAVAVAVERICAVATIATPCLDYEDVAVAAAATVVAAAVARKRSATGTPHCRSPSRRRCPQAAAASGPARRHPSTVSSPDLDPALLPPLSCHLSWFPPPNSTAANSPLLTISQSISSSRDPARQPSFQSTRPVAATHLPPFFSSVTLPSSPSRSTFPSFCDFSDSRPCSRHLSPPPLCHPKFP